MRNYIKDFIKKPRQLRYLSYTGEWSYLNPKPIDKLFIKLWVKHNIFHIKESEFNPWYAKLTYKLIDAWLLTLILIIYTIFAIKYTISLWAIK
jgi:hypothetical protein